VTLFSSEPITGTGPFLVIIRRRKGDRGAIGDYPLSCPANKRQGGKNQFKSFLTRRVQEVRKTS